MLVNFGAKCSDFVSKLLHLGTQLGEAFQYGSGHAAIIAGLRDVGSVSRRERPAVEAERLLDRRPPGLLGQYLA
jgi:hypothetical protein